MGDSSDPDEEEYDQRTPPYYYTAKNPANDAKFSEHVLERVRGGKYVRFYGNTTEVPVYLDEQFFHKLYAVDFQFFRRLRILAAQLSSSSKVGPLRTSRHDRLYAEEVNQWIKTRYEEITSNVDMSNTQYAVAMRELKESARHFNKRIIEHVNDEGTQTCDVEHIPSYDYEDATMSAYVAFNWVAELDDGFFFKVLREMKPFRRNEMAGGRYPSVLLNRAEYEFLQLYTDVRAVSVWDNNGAFHPMVALQTMLVFKRYMSKYYSVDPKMNTPTTNVRRFDSPCVYPDTTWTRMFEVKTAEQLKQVIRMCSEDAAVQSHDMHECISFAFDFVFKLNKYVHAQVDDTYLPVLVFDALGPMLKFPKDAMRTFFVTQSGERHDNAPGGEIGVDFWEVSPYDAEHMKAVEYIEANEAFYTQETSQSRIRELETMQSGNEPVQVRRGVALRLYEFKRRVSRMAQGGSEVVLESGERELLDYEGIPHVDRIPRVRSLLSLRRRVRNIHLGFWMLLLWMAHDPNDCKRHGWCEHELFRVGGTGKHQEEENPKKSKASRKLYPPDLIRHTVAEDTIFRYGDHVDGLRKKWGWRHEKMDEPYTEHVPVFFLDWRKRAQYNLNELSTRYFLAPPRQRYDALFPWSRRVEYPECPKWTDHLFVDRGLAYIASKIVFPGIIPKQQLAHLAPILYRPSAARDFGTTRRRKTPNVVKKAPEEEPEGELTPAQQAAKKEAEAARLNAEIIRRHKYTIKKGERMREIHEKYRELGNTPPFWQWMIQKDAELRNVQGEEEDEEEPIE
jgi:hypothetical protein